MAFSFRLKGLWKQSGKRPWLLEYRSSKWFILITVAMAVFTDIFLYAVIVPVMPWALKERVHVKDENIQSWVSILISVYGGVLAVCSPFCGWVADRSSSRRLPLVLGLLALGASTVLLNLGQSIGILILGRVLQGVSAAVVWTVGLALLADTVPQAEIGQTMGYVFVAMSFGVLLGPLLGGIVFGKGGYNEVFAMVYILIGVDVALRFMIIEKKFAKQWEIQEENGTKKPGEEVVINLKDILKGEDRGKPGITGDLKTDTADTITSSPRTSNTSTEETPRQAPLTPKKISKYPPVITLLKSRRLLCALWGVLVVAILMTQFDSVLPIFVRNTFGWNATGAGLIFLPLVLPSLFSPLIGWAIDKYGGRWLAVLGFLSFAPFEILLRLVDHDSLNQKVLLCALLTVIGFALGFCTPPIMVEITSVVEAKERENPGLFGQKGAYAQAYGLFNLAWASGCLVGPIWAGFVNERAGWGTMSWSLALLSALTAIPAGVWTGGYFFKKNRGRWRDRLGERRVDDVETNG